MGMQTKAELMNYFQGEGTSELLAEEFFGIHFDSRFIKQNDLFIALSGAKAKGEDYLAEAFIAGAVLAIVESEELLDNSPFKDRLIQVPSSFYVLEELGKYQRSTFHAPIISVVGSIGKTTTKEIFRTILNSFADGIATEKSYNGKIGVPYTLFHLETHHRWACLEMGMNQPDQLRKLSQIVRPKACMITRIAPEHMEFFGTLDAVADAECEILDGLETDGKIVIPIDDEVLHQALARHPRIKEFEILTFGNAAANAELVEYETNGTTSASYAVRVRDELFTFDSKVIGAHNGQYMAGALLLASEIFPKLDLPKAIDALARMTPAPGRLNVRTLPSGQTIIDDSYNASPEAVIAALEITREIVAQQEKKRLGCILGEMRELGTNSQEYHEKVGRVVEELKPDFLITVAGDAKFFASKALRTSTTVFDVDTVDEVAEILKDQKFDVLLVKGSNSIQLDKITMGFAGPRVSPPAS
jgi:UDP-N-acetylmuramoyl-tripeptide--D-alanyl-D-alanine ligase